MSRRLKAKLAKGQPVSVINPDHPSPSLVERLAKLGFDGAFIDCEHGTAGIERVAEMGRAARAAGIASIVRPDTTLPWLITRYLHCGVDGVMVPMVHDARTAQEIVDTVRYAAPDDFDERFIVLMVESTDGIRNLPEILKVEGVDVFFIGPGDLSQSMGYPPRVFEGEARPAAVVEALDAALKRILDGGKVAGTLVNRADVQEYLQKGVRYLYDHANHYLGRGAKEFLELVATA